MAVDWDQAVLAPVFGVFAEAARPVYTPVAAGGAAYPIDGVFDEAYRDLSLLDGDSTANIAVPVLGVRLSQFAAAPVVNDTVYVPSVARTYVIRNVEADGHGWAKLRLNVLGAPPSGIGS